MYLVLKIKWTNKQTYLPPIQSWTRTLGFHEKLMYTKAKSPLLSYEVSIPCKHRIVTHKGPNCCSHIFSVKLVSCPVSTAFHNWEVPNIQGYSYPFSLGKIDYSIFHSHSHPICLELYLLSCLLNFSSLGTFKFSL